METSPKHCPRLSLSISCIPITSFPPPSFEHHRSVQHARTASRSHPKHLVSLAAPSSGQSVSSPPPAASAPPPSVHKPNAFFPPPPWSLYHLSPLPHLPFLAMVDPLLNVLTCSFRAIPRKQNSSTRRAGGRTLVSSAPDCHDL
eukprot:766718-Hanusia_phi.AAC.8